MNMAKSKKLIAYFSHTGENYFGGKIVEIKVGNTAVVAGKLAALTGADVFEIKAAKPYPHAYSDCTATAKVELKANSRPALAENIDVSAYDVVFLGYPNWWGTMPMPVWTFLESGDFSGKTIIPFCTNEGSGMGASERDLKKLCPSATVKDGLAIIGSTVNNADDALKNLLLKL